jgi:hypothetical protein
MALHSVSGRILSKHIVAFDLSKGVDRDGFSDGVFMASEERDALIRQYSASEITWSAPRDRGLKNYVEVLGALGLRPSVAANVER